MGVFPLFHLIHSPLLIDWRYALGASRDVKGGASVVVFPPIVDYIEALGFCVDDRNQRGR